MITIETMPTAKTSWAAILLIVVAGIVAALHAGKVAIAAPLLQSEWGLGPSALGWLTGLFALIGFMGGIVTGSLTGRLGAQRLLVAGLLVMALGAASGALMTEFYGLLLSRIAEGAGFLLITVAAPALLNDVTHPKDRDWAFALWSCFMPLGIALAMIVGPMFTNWQMLWWASSSLSLAICWLVPYAISASPLRQDSSWQKVYQDTHAVLHACGPTGLAALFLLYSVMFFAVFSFLPVLMMDRLGVSHTSAGMLSALALMTNVLGNLAAGFLLARGVNRYPLLLIACLVMGLTGLGLFLPSLPGTAALGLSMLFFFSGGLIPATVLAAAPNVAPTTGLVPVVLGFIVQGNNLGQILGAIIIGSALQWLGWSSASYLVAGTALLAICVVIATSHPS